MPRRVTYKSLDVHPEGLAPPPPCNGWCVRTEHDEDGTTADTVMPWLNDLKDKRVCVGVEKDGDGQSLVMVDHLGFSAPDYITMPVDAYETNDDGNVVFEDEQRRKPKIKFQYVYGTSAINFIAEQVYRSEQASSRTQTLLLQAMNGLMKGLEAINNNLVVQNKMLAQALNIQSEISVVGQQAGLPGEKVE